MLFKILEMVREIELQRCSFFMDFWYELSYLVFYKSLFSVYVEYNSGKLFTKNYAPSKESYPNYRQ